MSPPQQIVTQPCNLEVNSYGCITKQLKNSGPKLAIHHFDGVYTIFFPVGNLRAWRIKQLQKHGVPVIHLRDNEL